MMVVGYSHCAVTSALWELHESIYREVTKSTYKYDVKKYLLRYILMLKTQ